MGNWMTQAGADDRTRNRCAPGGRPTSAWVARWPLGPAEFGTRSAGTRPPAPGRAGRQAHRWCHGPAAGPPPADPRRRPPRGVRPSGRRRWPRPPRASPRAARSCGPDPGAGPGPGGLRRAPGPRSAPDARASANARNSASTRASPVSSLLSGADVRAASTWATGCHRAGSPSGVAPRPGEAPSREAWPADAPSSGERSSAPGSSQPPSGQPLSRQPRSSLLPSSLRRPASPGPAARQRPLPAGTVRPAAPLAFGHAAFETTRRPDALHGADPRAGPRPNSRVPRPRMLTARNRG